MQWFIASKLPVLNDLMASAIKVVKFTHDRVQAFFFRHDRNRSSYNSPMTMADKEPDETLRFGNDVVTLYLGTAMVNQSSGDRMFVQHYTGQEEEVVIFLLGNDRKVARVVQTIDFIDTQVTVHIDSGLPTLAQLPEEDEKRLLAIYDRLRRRSFT